MAAEDKISQQCQQLVEKLDRTVKLHPREIEKEIDQVQRDLVNLRDALIDQRRHAAADAADRKQSELNTINIALSLVVAVEYPVTSIQRLALEQARDTLKSAFTTDRFGDRFTGG